VSLAHSTGSRSSCPCWSLVERTVIDSDRSLDPAARVSEYRQLSASVEIPTAYLSYSGALPGPPGPLLAAWGPGWTGSLIVTTPTRQPTVWKSATRGASGLRATSSRVGQRRVRAFQTDPARLRSCSAIMRHRIDCAPFHFCALP